jgi:hypothetical protein
MDKTHMITDAQRRVLRRIDRAHPLDGAPGRLPMEYARGADLVTLRRLARIGVVRLDSGRNPSWQPGWVRCDSASIEAPPTPTKSASTEAESQSAFGHRQSGTLPSCSGRARERPVF